MQRQPARACAQNIFTGYGNDHVRINMQRHDKNIVVLPDRLIIEWTPATFTTLTTADFETLATLDDSEVILLGTGKQQRFPHPELLRPLIEARKSLEVMDIPAACRTYNLLLSEGRKIAAALLFS